MKLRNRKTGKIVEFRYLQSDYVAPLVLTTYENDKPEMYSYKSLTKFNEEWEDYEEPKTFFTIYYDGTISEFMDGDDEQIRDMKVIGNYFETEEEAEKAVEKLKAWKLLKDECDFKFDGIIRDDKAMLKSVKVSYDRHQVTFERMRECVNALHMLFGGEE
jgi:hypothetical protein